MDLLSVRNSNRNIDSDTRVNNFKRNIQKEMKIILTLMLVFIVSASMGQTLSFDSNHCTSGSYLKEEHHIISLHYGNNEKSCDTLLVDNMMYFVLINGNTGEETKKGSGKFNWCTEVLRLNNTSGGRWISKDTFDYAFRCEIYTGKIDGKKVSKVLLWNHGSFVIYLM